MDDENHYRPLPEGLLIEESRIEGQGLFTDRFIHRNTNLGLCNIETMSCPPMLVRTPLGGFINHSDEPNCMRVQKDNRWNLVTITNILPGEELTLCYTMYKPDDVKRPIEWDNYDEWLEKVYKGKK